MKLLHTVLFSAAMLASVAAAKAQQPIVAAADVGYAPFAVVGDDGKFKGIDIDIAAALSKEMGVEIKVIDQPWSATIPGLIAKKFDMILAPATITAERAQNILFAEGYGDATYGFLLNAKGPDVKSLEDLKGKVVATNKGNLFDRWISAEAPKYNITVQRFDKHSDAAAAVASGQADAAVMYTASAGWLSKENPIFKPSTFYVDRKEYFGYAFNLDDAATRNKVDAALECLKTKGVLGQIFQKWTGLPPVKGGMTETVVPGYGPEGMPHYDPTPHPLNCKA
ncbi:substrate-binding periplasmic protein [Aquabacter sp. P-9]|uniref:substrate-binding periplasmic protein n=1 Tax=Aquabacter sediminis TaxID=3029197 RepID=UPI00237EBA94|nr:transporter substrate-binding domain-containing protein [Aquabacter sp. P-9]MDE1568029.1 transporter substrate-binding domain-containing protein [Aquabacter sp. P-9]